MKKNFITRIWTSLTVRVGVVVLILIALMCWALTAGVLTAVRYTSTSQECIIKAAAVKRDIDNWMERVQTTVKAGALASQTKKLNADNARSLCDSIRSMGDLDSVYICLKDCTTPQVKAVLDSVWQDNQSHWSEPYLSHEKPVLTFVTPMTNAAGQAYAMLCADIPLQQVQALVNNVKNDQVNMDDYLMVPENATPEQIQRTQEIQQMIQQRAREMSMQDAMNAMMSKAHITVVSKDRRIISSPDSLSQATLAQAPDSLFEDNDWNFTMKGEEIIRIADIPQNGWKVICSMSARESSLTSLIVRGFTISLVTFLGILITWLVILFIRWQLSPLRQITEATEAVAAGNFDSPLPKVKSYSDIRFLRDNFALMQDRLKKYIQDLKTTTEQKASMESELNIASTIQKGMLPDKFPALPDRNDLDIYGMQTPAKSVGGDLFDFFLREEKLYFCIGDVSGKGIPAALVMMATIHLFRNVGRHTESPSDICSAINVGLADGNEQNMFCTLFVGVLDLQTGRLDYCNGGHNAPVFIRKGLASYMQVKTNMPTGVFAELTYQGETAQLEPGDALVLYTDGVTEAMNPAGELFGDDATLQSMSQAATKTMSGLINQVLTDLHQFVAGAEQSDDITLLALRYQPDNKQPQA